MKPTPFFFSAGPTPCFSPVLPVSPFEFVYSLYTLDGFRQNQVAFLQRFWRSRRVTFSRFSKPRFYWIPIGRIANPVLRAQWEVRNQSPHYYHHSLERFFLSKAVGILSACFCFYCCIPPSGPRLTAADKPPFSQQRSQLCSSKTIIGQNKIICVLNPSQAIGNAHGQRQACARALLASYERETNTTQIWTSKSKFHSCKRQSKFAFVKSLQCHE